MADTAFFAYTAVLDPSEWAFRRVGLSCVDGDGTRLKLV
jgi:hypothetical protein